MRAIAGIEVGGAMLLSCVLAAACGDRAGSTDAGAVDAPVADRSAAPDSGGSQARDASAEPAPPDAPADVTAGEAPPADAATGQTPAGLGPWTGNDNVPASQRPPGNLRPDQVPMFVSLGFDDNPEPEPMEWVIDLLGSLRNPPGTGQAATHDGTRPKASFYNTTLYPVGVPGWKAAHAAGHETANHTVNHHHGAGGPGGMNFDAAGWRREIEGCTEFLTGPSVGIPRAEIVGFRTPYGQYNAALFPVLKQLGFWYDCSIDEGQQADQDGTNYFWPYTLDGGSPGHTARRDLAPITDWPKGLWEMPIYALLAPPDAEAAKYGVAPGLARKLGNNGKITGMDWNLWFGVNLTAPEFVAVLKYTLDQRLKGNRAPLLVGMHSKLYAAAGWERPPMATPAQARAAVREFLEYALRVPDVRVVSTRSVLDWVRNPVPLR